MVQGHVGDVPMHRLPTQLLLSPKIRYFSPETSAGAHRNSAAVILGEGEGGGTTVHTLDIRKSWDSDSGNVRNRLQNGT